MKLTIDEDDSPDENEIKTEEQQKAIDPFSDEYLYQEYADTTGKSATYKKHNEDIESKAYLKWRDAYLTEMEKAIEDNKGILPETADSAAKTLGIAEDVENAAKMANAITRIYKKLSDIMKIEPSMAKDMILDLMATYAIESEAIALVVYAEKCEKQKLITQKQIILEELGETAYNNALSIINLDPKQYPLFPSDSERNEKYHEKTQSKFVSKDDPTFEEKKKKTLMGNNYFVALKFLYGFLDKAELVCPKCGAKFYEPTPKDIERLTKIADWVNVQIVDKEDD